MAKPKYQGGSLSDSEVVNVGEDVKAVEKEEKELIVPKNAIVDVPVWVVSLDADPFHETGAEFQMGKKTAEEKAKLGWVEIKKEEEKK